SHPGIRDSSLTLYGLMRLGYTEEAAAFMRWMMARCDELEPDGSLQVMYGLDGRHSLPEETLAHLEGYMASSPVRIGNAAFDNLQLDIYGELMDSVYLYDKYGSPIGYDAWTNIVRLIDWVCVHWREGDETLWGVRGGGGKKASGRFEAGGGSSSTRGSCAGSRSIGRSGSRLDVRSRHRTPVGTR